MKQLGKVLFLFYMPIIVWNAFTWTTWHSVLGCILLYILWYVFAVKWIKE